MEQPQVRLLDRDLVILRETLPSDDRSISIRSEDRHRLQGYGTTYLQRVFNNAIFTADNDPVYEEAAKFSTALAIHASQRCDRDIQRVISEARVAQRRNNINQSSPSPPIQLEFWRFTKCANLLFDGIVFSSKDMRGYLEYLSHNVLNEESLPKSFEVFLDKLPPARKHERSPAASLLHQIHHLAKIVMLLAHIADVESCADIPLRMTGTLTSLVGLQIEKVYCNLHHRGMLRHHDIFHGVAKLLTESSFDSRDDDPSLSGRFKNFLWLISDFGWSVFLDTAGEQDPSFIRPELVRIQKGTPVNKETGERKFRVRDGHGYYSGASVSGHVLRGEFNYTPRAAAKVPYVSKYWNTASQDFECSVALAVKPEPELVKVAGTEPFENIIGYRQMHVALWRVYSTSACEHYDPSQSETQPIRLGPDAVAILGWCAARSPSTPLPQRILVLSTKGDSGLRWLAVMEALVGTTISADPEQTMLRTLDCCDDCALKYTASMPGRWYLIL